MFYNLHLIRGVTLSADLQYIDTSFGAGDFVTRTPDDAWVGGLRLRIVF